MEDLKEELLHINFAIYKKALQYWNTSIAGWIVYFDNHYNPKDLKIFLHKPIKKIIKYNPVFAFRGKKVFNRYQKDTKPIKSAIRKKKQEDLEKALHLEVLNNHKRDKVSVLKKIFDSNQ